MPLCARARSTCTQRHPRCPPKQSTPAAAVSPNQQDRCAAPRALGSALPSCSRVSCPRAAHRPSLTGSSAPGPASTARRAAVQSELRPAGTVLWSARRGSSTLFAHRPPLPQAWAIPSTRTATCSSAGTHARGSAGTTSTSRSRRRPCEWATRPARTSSQLTSGRRRGGRRHEDLLQRVAAEAEAERLEWDHFLGRDVAEVHARELPKCSTNQACEDSSSRVDSQIVESISVRGSRRISPVRMSPSLRKILAAPPSLRPPWTHLPGARFELLLDRLHPLIRRVDDAPSPSTAPLRDSRESRAEVRLISTLLAGGCHRPSQTPRCREVMRPS